jgi:hypothetical protein
MHFNISLVCLITIIIMIITPSNYVRASDIEPPIPISPVQSQPQSTAISLNPTFTWTVVPTAVSYEFQLTNSPPFTTLIDSQAMSVNSYTYLGDGLDYDTDYYWRVRAVAEDGTKSEWSSYSVWDTDTGDWVSIGALTTFHTMMDPEVINGDVTLTVTQTTPTISITTYIIPPVTTTVFSTTTSISTTTILSIITNTQLSIITVTNYETQSPIIVTLTLPPVTSILTSNQTPITVTETQPPIQITNTEIYTIYQSAETVTQTQFLTVQQDEFNSYWLFIALFVLVTIIAVIIVFKTWKKY